MHLIFNFCDKERIQFYFPVCKDRVNFFSIFEISEVYLVALEQMLTYDIFNNWYITNVDIY